MKPRLQTLIGLAFAVLATIVPAVAQSTKDAQQEKTDALFAQWNKPDSPGCALAVIKDGQVVYKRGYGSANLDYDIPISSRTVFNIASTSKQFTAISIALLARQGKLTLDDDIRKYLPEMPQYSAPVSIRRLLNHTSGVREYSHLMQLSGIRFQDATVDEIYKIIARQKELNFKPGDEYLYSNSGYFLLARIVQKVSGKSLRAFAEENIFKPLGMSSTRFRDDHSEVIKNRAAGYSSRQGGGFAVESTTSDSVGDGGLLTTIDDLILWDRLFDQKTPNDFADVIREALTRGTLNNGEKIDYGFVGDIDLVDAKVLQQLLEDGFMPVVSPVSADDSGTLLNINADTVAAAIGGALKAEKLMLCTGAPGILESLEDPRSVVSYTDLAGLKRLKDQGSLKDGMLPKAKAIEDAIRAGVRRVHVISYKSPDSLLAEVFTNEGTGTLIVSDINALSAAEQSAGD